MKEFILKTDLSISKIEEDCAKVSSWSDKSYILQNGFKVMFSKQSGSIKEVKICLDGDKQCVPEEREFVEFFDKFGTNTIKLEINDVIIKLTELVCNVPFLKLDPSIFSKPHINDILEMAQFCRLLYKIGDNQYGFAYYTNLFKAEFGSTDCLEIIRYINTKGYKCEIEKKESQQTTAQSNEIVF